MKAEQRFKRPVYIDSEGQYSQDTAPRNKAEECDVYIKTEDLSKDEFVVVSQEELASLVLARVCHNQTTDTNTLVRFSV